MGDKLKTVGGSKLGRGVSDEFLTMLGGLLGGGGGGRGYVGAGTGPAGQDAVNQTQGGVGGILGDILSGGAGRIGGALGQQLQSDITSGRNTLRARFGAGGGQAFGTPGAYAESKYNAAVAPEITKAIGGLQLQAINPLLQAAMGVYGRETPQAQIMRQPGALSQITNTLGTLAPIAADIFAPGLGTATNLASKTIKPGNVGESPLPGEEGPSYG